jgi:hypothetical protein|tara:strand:+ start:579 stop:959 length:381 start_codon:yes stop_codon:yes gene_type:complete
VSDSAPAIIRVERLPGPALDAAAAFHAHWAQQVGAAAIDSEFVILVMDPAPFDHADWRRAAARDLARAHADNCINIVAGLEGAALARMVEFLGRAPAITGQYLPLADSAPCESGSDGRLGDDDTDG